MNNTNVGATRLDGICRGPAVYEVDERGHVARSSMSEVVTRLLRKRAESAESELAAIRAEIPAELLVAHQDDAAAAVRAMVG